MRYQYLLFDLDGTITDPKEGITKSAQYALEAFGIHEPDADKLTPFIGPPLIDSFQEFYHMPPEQAALAVKKYRERFETIGWLENVPYEGMDELLRDLQKAGCRLAVASSKPTVFVERILAHFDIAQYFAVVVGSELSGARTKKEEVVQEVRSHLEHSRGGYTSIYADLRDGRKTEVDTISGSVVRASRRNGVPAPSHEFTVHLIHALEDRHAMVPEE